MPRKDIQTNGNSREQYSKLDSEGLPLTFPACVIPLFQPYIGTAFSGLSPYNLGTLRKPSAKAVGVYNKVPLTKLEVIWVMPLVGLVPSLPSPTVNSVMVIEQSA